MAQIDKPVIGVLAYGQAENADQQEKSCNHKPIDEVVSNQKLYSSLTATIEKVDKN